MAIQSIDTEIIKAYFHSGQPDIPQKSAQEMKEFFDAMPKKVLIPKLNELIDELNSGGYGKSAYTIACENGFEGSEAEWLQSLKGATGKTGPKGDKGADATVKLSSQNDITEEGLYLVDGEYLLASPDIWDTDLSKPFEYTGNVNLLDKIDWNYDDSAIPNADKVENKGALWGVPLLKYANTQGDGNGATYILLRWDNTTLLVYSSDLADAVPWYADGFDLLGEGKINLSRLITEQYTVGLGEDICGNFAKISKYFKEGLNIEKLVTQRMEFTNALKGNKTGSAVLIDDPSPIAHELKVSVADVKSLPVTVKRYSKNLLPYPYKETSLKRNGITFTDNGDGTITVDGTSTEQWTTFSLVPSGVEIDLKDGVTYSILKTAIDNIKLYCQYKNENGETRWAQDNFVWSDAYEFVQCYLQIDKEGVNFDKITIYPQIEMGDKVTAYERYLPPESIVLKSKSIIEHIPALYPTTVLTADGATVSVEYNRDINKAFAKLEG